METIKKGVEKVKEMAHQAPTEKDSKPGMLTRQTGCPVFHNKVSMTAGPQGPLVVSDTHLLEKIMLFNSEKIPARNVHALGTGAHGTFTVTNPDLSKWTCAKLFSEANKKTDLFVRFSGIFTEQGDADTTRDPRGFAIKFYTEEGNWDLLGINTPCFLVRDAKVGPDAIHANKRDPRTGMWSPTQAWDFTANHPEALHQILMLYTDRIGTPLSYRHMNAYGCHTFSFVNAEKQRFWVKFHIISMQGARGMTRDQAKLVAGEDPNFLSRDLKEAIDKSDYPHWRFCFQVMPEAEGYRHPWTFDATKVWSHREYPLIEIGTIELNRNPIDYFSEVEQAAFSPVNVVPGIGLSPDKLLQGRLLIYDDTQRHRIGPNFKQLPVNRPKFETHTQRVGGAMNTEVKDHFPHYWPSDFGGPQPAEDGTKSVEIGFRCDGDAGFYAPIEEGSDSDLYKQPADLLKVLNSVDREHLCDNIASSLEKVRSDSVVSKMLYHLHKIDQHFGDSIENKLKARKMGTAKKSEGEMLIEKFHMMLHHEAKA